MTSIKISKMVASGLGSGFSPIVSGTTGSAAAILAWFLICGGDGAAAWWLIPTFFALGMWATAIELKLDPNDSDPSHVVIDEWAGQMIPLLLVERGDYLSIVLAFIFFRIFDILKPFPVHNAEELPGALGVMLDDLLAGVYAAIFLWAVQKGINFA